MDYCIDVVYSKRGGGVEKEDNIWLDTKVCQDESLWRSFCMRQGNRKQFVHTSEPPRLSSFACVCVSVYVCVYRCSRAGGSCGWSAGLPAPIRELVVMATRLGHTTHGRFVCHIWSLLYILDTYMWPKQKEAPPISEFEAKGPTFLAVKL